MFVRLLVLLLFFIVQRAEAAGLGQTLPESDPKYRVVRTVFERLARTGSRVPPKLYVLRSDVTDTPLAINFGVDPLSRIKVSEQGKYIAIDESLVDLMAGLGSSADRDNGLAFLLGHELAHYAAWQSGSFTTSGFRNEAAHRQSEAQADRLGSWYALEAGYDPFPAAEKAILAVYRRYHPGQSQIVGYPSLKERIAIINHVKDQVAQKVPFFEAATLLLAVNQPLESARLFEHLARDFQGREILNNAGVANALAALAIPPEPTFYYPFELETAFRYRIKTRGGPGEQEEKRNSLLGTAADLFDRVLLLAPEYAAGHLNRAAVAELQKNRNKLDYHVSEAEDLAKGANDLALNAQVKILRGIALANSGKSKEAEALFREALPYVGQLAVSNLRALGLQPDQPAAVPAPDTSVIETVNRLAPGSSQDVARIPLSGVFELRDSYDTTVKIYRKKTDDWTGMRLQIGNLTISSFATADNYAGVSARGIKVGDSRKELVLRYGPPVRMISSRQEALYVFDRDRIVVRLDRDDKVTGWVVYNLILKQEPK